MKTTARILVPAMVICLLAGSCIGYAHDWRAPDREGHHYWAPGHGEIWHPYGDVKWGYGGGAVHFPGGAVHWGAGGNGRVRIDIPGFGMRLKW